MPVVLIQRAPLGQAEDASAAEAASAIAPATQSLQGTYASHPECLARPQFDAGATNRYWIAYGSSSFTVSFAAPVTGASRVINMYQRRQSDASGWNGRVLFPNNVGTGLWADGSGDAAGSHAGKDSRSIHNAAMPPVAR